LRDRRFDYCGLSGFRYSESQQHGFAAGNDVIEKIKELRKNTEDFSDPSPETKAQINMVLNWKKGL
jgi:hypothetical protein